LTAFSEEQTAGRRPAVIVFGKKGARFLAKFSGLELIGEFEDNPDVPPANLFAPVLEVITEGLYKARFNRVVVIYTAFGSALNQSVRTVQLLPFSLSDTADEEIPGLSYEFEPNIESVIEESGRLYLEASLMQAKVDSSASEYAMRMIAMGSANRNASQLIDDLTLELNSYRQAAITQEIAEITGGANAIDGGRG
jgi:F-type H+-transporting ATPase subunit gamma